MSWRFEDIAFIYMLPLVVGAILFFYYASWYFTQKKKYAIGNAALINAMILNYGEKAHWRKCIFFILATIFLFLALANPQLPNQKEKVKAQGADVFIILDISNSMLAEDILPNRLTNAKNEIAKMITALKGNRIALIYFAGSAFLQMPLTLDYGAATILVKAANTDQIGTQGSNLTEAFLLAEKAELNDKNASNIIVLVSDVESHDQDALNIAKTLADKAWMINVIGVGTEAGGFIPMNQYGESGYKRDESGEVVRTKLNIKLMNELASLGNGVSLNSSDPHAISKIVNRVNSVKSGELTTLEISSYTSLYQYFLFIALFLYLVYSIYPMKMNLKLNTFVFFFSTFLVGPISAQKQKSDIIKGNNLYKEGNYAKAIEHYDKALSNEQHTTTLYNRGTALLKSGKYDESISSLQSAISSSGSSAEDIAKAHYNLGNAYFKNKKIDESIDQYKDCLRYNKNDEDAKSNLVKAKLLKKQIQRQQQKQQNQKQENQENNKNQPDNKNQDNTDNYDNQDKQNKSPNQDRNQDNQEKKSAEENRSRLTKEQQKQLSEFVKAEDQKVQQKLQHISAKKHKNAKDW